MTYVSKEFRFEAAHSLPHLPATHKCSKLHGHSYKVVFTFSGLVSRENPWVIDYADIAKEVEPILTQLDHQNLNDLMKWNDGVSVITTAENIARWLFDRIPHRLSLFKVDLYETPTTCATYVR